MTDTPDALAIVRDLVRLGTEARGVSPWLYTDAADVKFFAAAANARPALAAVVAELEHLRKFAALYTEPQPQSFSYVPTPKEQET